jgi:23S rRNA pseudouridine2604 synthase
VAGPTETIRLNKRMAERGLCSRREADDWIAKGWVKVNGQVATMGLQVKPADRIEPAGHAGHHPAEQADRVRQRPGRGRA